MKRVFLAVLLLLAACSAPQAAPAPAPSAEAPEPPPVLGTNGAAVPALHWTSCHGPFQCAAAAVPLSYREPRGATISLSVVRLPAGDPGRRLGSLFFNFGGPGTDGVGELTRFAARYPPELRARFDLVSFDPRGIGGSAPIGCASPDQPAGSPIRQPDAFFAASAATGKACAASGDLLSHLSTANVARDMELLRQAIGDASLNFYGYSYGTYLGGTYANLFGDKVRAMTLDGTLDLVANATGRPGQAKQPVDVRADVAGAQQQELDRFFAACAAAGPKCAFSAGDPKRKFAGIFAHASRGPGVGSLMKTVTSALYQSGRWKRLAQTLAAMPADPGPAAPVLDPYVPTHSPGFLAVQCVDSDNPQSPADYAALATTESARQPYFGLSAVYSMAQCVGWPAHDEDRYTGPWNRPRKNPILVLNNRFDPATPLHNAEATAAELGDGRVLVVDGYGHTSLDAPSTCASAAVVRYLTELAAPAPGTTCAPDAVPFP
ncbi:MULTISPECIES: alpha/beta hydrolase [unclassified Amycolatopsis]|uniref:alpha/beta hydrolase n=1 Tax=unclassified Amycolatopsis TaxID=2618356 RepID=UPI002875DD3A|nr:MULTISPECIES: alpha/beta hydrolase [unclassified Amycolatopsis]MDS0138553.1 alpha/beta fold hydrolase [Amycolatopsis sp. 505]MDS0146170.1 alpha/beta fold hydrolase [Amycolatopsis sp. CM201R]